jgi:hypothetical protein
MPSTSSSCARYRPSTLNLISSSLTLLPKAFGKVDQNNRLFEVDRTFDIVQSLSRHKETLKGLRLANDETLWWNRMSSLRDFHVLQELSLDAALLKNFLGDTADNEAIQLLPPSLGSLHLRLPCHSHIGDHSEIFGEHGMRQFEDLPLGKCLAQLARLLLRASCPN